MFALAQVVLYVSAQVTFVGNGPGVGRGMGDEFNYKAMHVEDTPVPSATVKKCVRVRESEFCHITQSSGT